MSNDTEMAGFSRMDRTDCAVLCGGIVFTGFGIGFHTLVALVCAMVLMIAVAVFMGVRMLLRIAPPPGRLFTKPPEYNMHSMSTMSRHSFDRLVSRDMDKQQALQVLKAEYQSDTMDRYVHFTVDYLDPHYNINDVWFEASYSPPANSRDVNIYWYELRNPPVVVAPKPAPAKQGKMTDEEWRAYLYRRCPSAFWLSPDFFNEPTRQITDEDKEVQSLPDLSQKMAKAIHGPCGPSGPPGASKRGCKHCGHTEFGRESWTGYWACMKCGEWE